MSGFRLFRRKKLVPGVTMNLSLSGPSLRFGTRGAGITIGGRRRLRATVGIPGTGIYYTKTAGGGRRIRRPPAPLHSTYSAPATSASYKGCLYAIGVMVLLMLTVVTYGLVMIPVAMAAGAWIWHRRRQPAFIASRIIKRAETAEPIKTVDLLNQALEVDPHGLKTLRSCASWFYDHQCWQDSAEAYSGILQVQPDWDAERRYATSLLAAGRADDAIPHLEHMRAVSSSGDGDEAAVLGQMAMAYFMKGQPSQAMAFIDLAPLEMRNLDGALQQCLYLRAVGRYLAGDRRHAIGDLERLYAINPAFTDLMATKAAMESGTYGLPPAKPYPDWYPMDHRETNLAPAEPGRVTPATSPAPIAAAEPDSLLAAANVSPDWIKQKLWRGWDSPANLVRGESRHQDIFLARWSIDPKRQHWEPVAVDLVREPENPVDQNAVKAEIYGRQIGYLAREVAATFSPQLDRAARSQCTVAGVVCGGSADAPNFGLHLWLDKRLTEAPAWDGSVGRPT
ncbi:DUF4236 domain-containing protein [bacterium]|nr:MAG: DUF4236 domain-containing protein [bacterium]